MDKDSRPFMFLFAGLFLVFLWPLLLLRSSFISSDFFAQHLPWAYDYWRELHAGNFPFWTRQMAGGFPLAAEGQVGAFYLLNHFSYRFLPFLAAYTWSIPFHIFLGAAGFYFYAKRSGLGSSASWLGATLFAFASGYGGCFYNTGSLRVLSWLPWCLLLLESTRQSPPRRRLFALGLLALIFSQQWAAGFSQMAVYSFLYVLLHECASYFRKPADTLRAAAFVLAAIVLGTLIALPQFLLTVELIAHSVRSHESAGFALAGSMPPVFPVSLLFPSWGVAFGYSFYLGMLPAFLLLTAFIAHRDRFANRHLFLAIFFALLALGKYNPFYKTAIEWTHLTSMRYPYKFLFFAGFSLSVLAAWGFDRLLRARREGEADGKLSTGFLSLTFLTVFLPGAGSFCVFFAKPFWQKISLWYVESVLRDRGIHAKSAQYYMDGMGSFLGRLPALFSYGNLFNIFQIVLAVSSFVMLRAWTKKKISAKTFSILAVLVLFLDLTVFGFTLGSGFIGNSKPISSLVPDKVFQGMLAYPKEEGGAWAEFSAQKHLERMPPNSNMYYGVKHAGGYSPLLLTTYFDLAYDLGWVDSSLGRPASSLAVWEKERAVIDLLGARWIRSEEPLSLGGMRLISGEAGNFFYENEQVLGDITGYLQWKVLPDKDSRLAYLKGGGFDPRREVVLEDRVMQGGGDAALGSAVAGKLLEDKGEYLKASIDMPAEGVVLIRNSAYPGWTVRVDGVAEPWFVADHAFMGVRTGAGNHILELFYWPTHERASFFGMALGLALSLALMAPYWIKK